MEIDCSVPLAIENTATVSAVLKSWNRLDQAIVDTAISMKTAVIAPPLKILYSFAVTTVLDVTFVLSKESLVQEVIVYQFIL